MRIVIATGGIVRLAEIILEVTCVVVLISRWTYYDFFLRYRVLCHSKDVKKNDHRTTCQNIIAKLINDEDKYRFGKTKLFFRAGQVAYMEKLRSERLRDCGIMIQKNVKGWLYRKRYQQIRKSTMTIQRWTRGHLARRRVTMMRRTRAAIIIQKYMRGWIKRIQYQRLLARTLRMQARIRGCLARRRHREMLKNSKAIVIQKNVRGWLQRRKYQRTIKNVVLVQGLIRRFLAKKELKHLKIQAKSVEHQKKLNQGLENKIISLQQKLTASEKANKEFKAAVTNHREMVQELEVLRKGDQERKTAQNRITQLEEELAAVPASAISRSSGSRRP